MLLGSFRTLERSVDLSKKKTVEKTRSEIGAHNDLFDSILAAGFG